MSQIPFNQASLVGNELKYANESITTGRVMGDGPYTKRCRALLEGVLGARQALLTPSCTAALEMTALLLNIQAGDEVIVPAFTFVSTVNAFVLRGAKPVFCDIRADTLNLDERVLARLVSPRTRAIVVVHYAGVACEMDAILELARSRGIAVVEDNAHGLFGKYKGRYLGTMGTFGTQSFHETKNVTCGEGGALLVNDAAYVERAEIIREKGTNRSRFFRGEIDKYSWVDLGSSYLLSDILAAFLFAQLEERESIQAQRRRVWHSYHERLVDWAAQKGVTLPTVPGGNEQAYHMYYVILPSLRDRQEVIAHLKRVDIHAVFHYLPLHLSDMGRSFGGRPGDCPVTEDLSDRLLRLPFYRTLSEGEVERVVDSLRGWKQA